MDSAGGGLLVDGMGGLEGGLGGDVGPPQQTSYHTHCHCYTWGLSLTTCTHSTIHSTTNSLYRLEGDFHRGREGKGGGYSTTFLI